MGTYGASSSRIWIGVILILFGVFFLLDNFYYIPFDIPYHFRQWQWILVLIGIVILLTSKNKTGGIVLIAIGGLMLYGFKVVFPFLLVVLGLHFILRRRSPSTPIGDHSNTSKANYSQDVIDDVSIFGGGTKMIISNNFNGGKITAIFGGSEIVLSECKLAAGENILDIVAIFGGSTIVVPQDWKVILDLVPIFGGFSDNRRKDPNLVQPSDRTLVVKGLVLFGGGEIKT